ncbi:peptidase S8/S53 domain-containing protein [Microdochium trichocladiopsis]|uniref:Peptidase S8/S53 domain-containing protein n=1 Tax=Microdochium trichocladiopsis TaxID=1682393 RepID=A0A9P8YBE5_9PEZI|nr:peptidase S8/S53 domain-containing protein [Microdochium trichocladiopsis]KAH7033023.1 peptidase S8/S53 domain-containing protein [Microdochium trichocladiopsis]
MRLTKTTKSAVVIAATCIAGSSAEAAQTVGFIIELETTAASVMSEVHSSFHRRAASLLNTYTVRHEFTNTDYFFGLSIEGAEEADISALQELPEVKRIWPNRVHDRPMQYGMEATNSSSSPLLENPTRSRFLQPRNSTTTPLPHISGTSDVNSSLKMVGVDELHKLNITGKGVKIGILDTGIDYTHPALGSGFGPGFKVAGGADLVGDDYTGMNMPVPDPDPLAKCLEGGHGTHVAGIIGAEDPEGVGFGLIGVAPGAGLYMYRVFGCFGSVTDDVIMAALQRAGEDGVDVISMSLGYDSIWEAGSLYEPIFNALAAKGVGAVVAAGNSGGRGPYFASEPSLNPSVISVGSAGNINFATLYNAVDSQGKEVEYASIIPLEDSGVHHVATITPEPSWCTLNDMKQAVEPFTDKKNVILLVPNRLGCYAFAQFSKETGVTQIWQDTPDGVDFRVEPPGAAYTLTPISSKTLDMMMEGVAQDGRNYTLSFKDRAVHDAEQPTKGTMSSFSSFGPTMEMSLKPQLTGIGGNILSTWPTTDGTGYAIISGTSMSTPMMAGIYALVKETNPHLSPREIKERLQTTSRPLSELADQSLLSTPAQQGAGLVDALRAVQSIGTSVSPSELSLRDSATASTRKITIENHSANTQTYVIGHKGAAAVDAVPQFHVENKNNIWRWVANAAGAYASSEALPKSVEIAAGAKATVEVTITPPKGLEISKMPLYGGYVTIKSSQGQEWSVPYIGVPYSRAEQDTLATTDETLFKPVDQPEPPAGVPVLPYLFNSNSRKRNIGIDTYTFGGGDGVAMRAVIVQPSAYMRIDVVAANVDFNATHPGFDKEEVHDLRQPKGLDLETLDNEIGVRSYGALQTIVGGHNMPKFPYNEWYWRGYGDYGLWWTDGVVGLMNGTTYAVPDGDYRILIRALRFGQDVNKAESYESWLSPVVRVEKAGSV